MTCNYCTPNKQGERKPLDVDEHSLNFNYPRCKRNVFKIYRERNKKKKYFLGVHSKDVSEDGKVMFRNNGFIMKRIISFCPMCGRDLKQVIK